MHLSKKATIISLILITLIGLGVLGYAWDLNNKQNLEWKSKVKHAPKKINNVKIGQPSELQSIPIDFSKLPLSEKGRRIYKNKKYGFEIQLPDGWAGLEIPELERVQFYSDEKNRTELGIMDIHEVTVYYNSKRSKLDEWYKKNSKRKENILVDNKPAIKYINVKGGQDPNFPTVLLTIIVIDLEDKIYRISFETDRYSSKEHKFIKILDESIVEEILSTFKFI